MCKASRIQLACHRIGSVQDIPTVCR
ncbi:hypothetical protein F383_28928 [Gossypium arboreum]|uniref:Uncharacterized protein n=1 Tax=Gossypium arboreum TaxID=29729 RepID=A0A0B0MPM2_GOSAR|nr:hypothetical protein F383_28928 [Gossypium arboreum]